MCIGVWAAMARTMRLWLVWSADPQLVLQQEAGRNSPIPRVVARRRCGAFGGFTGVLATPRFTDVLEHNSRGQDHSYGVSGRR